MGSSEPSIVRNKSDNISVNIVDELRYRVFPFLILVTLMAAGWLLLSLIAESLTGKDSALVSALIAATAGFAATVLSAINKLNEVRYREVLAKERELEVQKFIDERSIQESHRANKVQVYSTFVELISDITQGKNKNNPRKPTSQADKLAKLEKFQNGLMIWGNPDTIRTYLTYKRGFLGDPMVSLGNADALFRALRADIGLSNEGLDEFELIEMYLRDPNQISVLQERIKQTDAPKKA